DALRDPPLPGVEMQPGEEVLRLADREPRHVHDGPPADLDPERLPAQPRPAADFALAGAHEVADLFAHRLGVGLAVAPLEVLDDALDDARELEPLAVALEVEGDLLGAGAGEDDP